MARRAGGSYKPAPAPPPHNWSLSLTARVRKLIGTLAILVFLVGYIGVMAAIGERLPEHWAIQLGFYVIAGLGWGVPILPLISWMNRGR